MKKALFIVIEGIDGSGKSTLAKNLTNALNEKGREVKFFFEPTNSETGQYIRKFLKKEISLSKQEVIEAFLSDREFSVNNNIFPTLQKGMSVILDRYFYSMAAYQGDEHFSPQNILDLNLKRNFPIPDVLFFLDLPPEEAFSRILARGESKERFESLSILKKISENYKQILPSSTISINAQMNPKEILEECLQHLKL